MKIEELMTRHLHTCGPGDSLERAAQIMWDHDVGCTPVVDDAGQLVGMLTDRDVCMAAYTRGQPLGACRVGDAMSRSLRCCIPGDDVSMAEIQMRQARVRRVPVVDGKRLVGLLTLNDLALAAEATHRAPSPEEIVTTLAAVGAPRCPTPPRPARPSEPPRLLWIGATSGPSHWSRLKPAG